MRAFIAGIGDDQGYGFAIAKALAKEGVEILIGTWPPVLKIFTSSWEMGKFNDSRKLPNGSLWNYAKVYPLDALYDKKEDVPEEVRQNKRYQSTEAFTISEVAEAVKKDFGQIDFFVHALANAPEVTKPLLETSRQGYLSALSASSYSFISLLSHFGPLMTKDGAALTLSYIASERVIPGYGGGMSSAKAALESDVRTLSYEAGKKWGIRVNAISAGPLRSRAAKAIGMIDYMIAYSEANAPLKKAFSSEDVANAAKFLLFPNAITGSILYVDNGLHAMGLAMDSKSLEGFQN